LIAYIDYIEKGDAAARKRAYWLCLGLSAMALLAKPMAVTLPLVLLLLDYFPLYRFDRTSIGQRVREKIPFIVLAGIAAAMNIAVKWTTSVPLSYVPGQARLMNAFHSVVFYIYQTAFPLNLLPIYQMDRSLDYLGPRFVLSMLAVALITAFCVWRAARKTRIWAAVWFYYVITLGPALGFFMAYRHAAADRYTYLPTMGMWLLVGLGAVRLWEMSTRLKQPLVARAGLAACVILVACLYGFQTHRQIAVWKNSETLWTYLIKHSEHVPDLAYFGIGKVLEEKGEFDAALANYRAGLELNPRDNRYRRKIAWVLAQKGETDQALAVIKENVEQEPRNPSAHVNMGKILALVGRYNEAAQSAQTALNLSPDFEPAYDLLMMISLEQNDLASAREYYRKRVSKGYSVPKEIEERLGITSRRGGPPGR
jgi:tetratricopeptide (TPR) repeat protein